MKLVNKIKKDKLLSQKKKYFFLIIIMLAGILSGIVFLFFIGKDDKTLLMKEINTFFTNIKENPLLLQGKILLFWNG